MNLIVRAHDLDKLRISFKNTQFLKKLKIVKFQNIKKHSKIKLPTVKHTKNEISGHYRFLLRISGQKKRHFLKKS